MRACFLGLFFCVPKVNSGPGLEYPRPSSSPLVKFTGPLLPARSQAQSSLPPILDKWMRSGGGSAADGGDARDCDWGVVSSAGIASIRL
jgi:hypothetical protein